MPFVQPTKKEQQMAKVELRISIQINDPETKLQTNRTLHYTIDGDDWQTIQQQLDTKAQSYNKSAPDVRRFGDPRLLRGAR